MKKKALVFITIVSMVVSQAAFGFAGEITDSTAETTESSGMDHVTDNFYPHVGNDKGEPIPAYITTKPVDDDSSAVLDFYITKEILMGAKAGQQELEVTDITVKNNSKTGIIEVSKIDITSANGWTLISKDALGKYNAEDNTYEYFADKKADTKEFYLAVKKSEDEDCIGTYDSITKSCVYTDSFPQKNNSSGITISFRCYTGLVTKQIEKELTTNVLVTVSLLKEATA
jgi:hypothetical protein